MIALRSLSFLSVLALSVAQDNGSSRLSIPIPHSLYKEEGYNHREALFGVPQYGGTISQNVYYADSNLCSPDVDKRKGYPARKTDKDGRMLPWPSPFILMVDTGGCSFTTKVRNAQHAGAAAVLLANIDCVCSHSECEGSCVPSEPSMADDGSGADIGIPSFLLFKQDADPIKQQLRKNVSVVVEMAWSLPSKAGERVKYELWTVPTDVISRELYTDFAEYATQLDGADFTPHVYLQSGLSKTCQHNTYGERWCETGCTNKGHYCALDPDHDITKGISGGDVVEEGLRRLCIWENYKDSEQNGLEWWTYTAEFSRQCETVDKFNSTRCIEDAYSVARIDKRLVEDCMVFSGGLVRDKNVMLENELELSKDIVVFPTMRVNGVELRGSLTAENVFSAICAAFHEEEQPQICQSCVKCLDVNECVYSGGKCKAGSNMSGGRKGGVSSGTFVLSLFVMIGAFAGVGFWYYKKSRAQMRDRVRDILAEYMALEDQPEDIDTPTFSFARSETTN